MPARSYQFFSALQSVTEPDDEDIFSEYDARDERPKLGRRKTYVAVGVTIGLLAFSAYAGAANNIVVAKSTSGDTSELQGKWHNVHACSNFNGMYTPSGLACCPTACGVFCGARNCDRGPGGSAQCCMAGMNQTCGASVAKLCNHTNSGKLCAGTAAAPCKLSKALATFMPNTTSCGQYGGIDHPSQTKCCPAGCGALCGSGNCWRSSLGYKACCSSVVTTQCTWESKKTPCMLSMDECGPYGGLKYPGSNKCCDGRCGHSWCGGSYSWRSTNIHNCSKSPWGKAGCCATAVPATCGATAAAPCMLPNGRTLYGEMSITCDDSSKLLNNQVVNDAFQDAIAQSQGVPSYDVKITSITARKSERKGRRLSNSRRLSGTAIVDYTIELADDSPKFNNVNAASLQTESTATAIASNVQKTLRAKAIPVTIQRVLVFVPVVSRGPATPAPPTTSLPAVPTQTGAKYTFGKVFHSDPVPCRFFFREGWEVFFAKTCMPAFAKTIAFFQSCHTSDVFDIKGANPPLQAERLGKGYTAQMNVTFRVGLSMMTPLARELHEESLLIQENGGDSQECCQP